MFITIINTCSGIVTNSINSSIITNNIHYVIVLLLLSIINSLGSDNDINTSYVILIHNTNTSYVILIHNT